MLVSGSGRAASLPSVKGSEHYSPQKQGRVLDASRASPAGTSTLSELQSVYERILGRRLDKSAFRKRIAGADFVKAIPGEMRHASNRPAQLYRLKRVRSTVFFNRTI
jgi:hypothetical protein